MLLGRVAEAAAEHLHRAQRYHKRRQAEKQCTTNTSDTAEHLHRAQRYHKCRQAEKQRTTNTSET